MPPVYEAGVLPDIPADEYHEHHEGDERVEPYYGLFRTEALRDIELSRPYYDKKSRAGATALNVYRFFAARSITDPQNSFLPFYCATARGNPLRYWRKRLYACLRIGAHSTSWIASPVDVPSANKWAIPTSRLCYSLQAMERSITRKPQKKPDHAYLTQRPYQVPDTEFWAWNLFQHNDGGKQAILTFPEVLYFYQGMVLMRKNEMTFQPGTADIPGWAADKPSCVLLFSSGLGRTIDGLLTQEKPNYAGDPDDYENRFVCGDVVSPDHGSFCWVRAKGQDLSGQEQIGFEARFEKMFNNMPARLARPEARERMRDKWKHWDPIKNAHGGVIDPGILYYPTMEEQIAKLCECFPKRFLVWSLTGDFDQFITTAMRNAVVSEAAIHLGNQPVQQVQQGGWSAPSGSSNVNPSNWNPGQVPVSPVGQWSSAPAPNAPAPSPALPAPPPHWGASTAFEPAPAVPAAQAAAPPMSEISTASPSGQPAVPSNPGVDDALQGMQQVSRQVFGPGAAPPQAAVPDPAQPQQPQAQGRPLTPAELAHARVKAARAAQQPAPAAPASAAPPAGGDFPF
jgi:hypothetical protein